MSRSGRNPNPAFGRCAAQLRARADPRASWGSNYRAVAFRSRIKKFQVQPPAAALRYHRRGLSGTCWTRSNFCGRRNPAESRQCSRRSDIQNFKIDSWESTARPNCFPEVDLFCASNSNFARSWLIRWRFEWAYESQLVSETVSREKAFTEVLRSLRAVEFSSLAAGWRG